MLALARLACDVPDEVDDAPVFAAIRGLLDGFDAYTAEHPDDRRRMAFLILATRRAPEPIPATCPCLRPISLPDQPQPDQSEQIVDLVDRLADERDDAPGRARRWRSRACRSPSSSRSRPTIPST